MTAAKLSPRSSTIGCSASNRSSHGWSQRVLMLCVVLTCLGESGCMSARLEELRHAPTRLHTGESVVLLSRPHIDGLGVEADFLNCLNRRLAGATLASENLETSTTFETGATFAVSTTSAGVAAQSLQLAAGAVPRRDATVARFELFPQRQFVDAFYPWLEPSTVPTDGAGLGKFLSRPGVRERVTSLGVRYIVWVDGATKKVDGGGSITCGIAAGGFGCFGLGWWQKKSSYEATIWDLGGGIGAGNVSTSVNGFSVLLGLGVPVPLIAPVQATACRRLSSQLEAFFRNETFQ